MHMAGFLGNSRTGEESKAYVGVIVSLGKVAEELDMESE